MVRELMHRAAQRNESLGSAAAGPPMHNISITVTIDEAQPNARNKHTVSTSCIVRATIDNLSPVACNMACREMILGVGVKNKPPSRAGILNLLNSSMNPLWNEGASQCVHVHVLCVVKCH